jgi:hypothetical protein
VCAAVALLLAIVVVPFRWATRVGAFTDFNFDRIQPGMTLLEVEHLFGGPGVEIDVQMVPRLGSAAVPFVQGEMIFIWKKAPDSYPEGYYVSFESDVVHEKYRYFHSL